MKHIEKNEKFLKPRVVCATMLCLVVFIAFALQARAEPGQPRELATSSASSLTLSMALDEGLKRSPDVQRARAASDETHWHRMSVLGGSFLPRLTLEARHYLNEQYSTTTINFGAAPSSFPGFYPNDIATLELQIPIFDGFAGYRNLQAADLLEDAGNQDRLQVEFQLRQDIRLAFYKALAASELQEVASQNVRTLEDHLNQVNVQKRGGVATKYDTLRVEVLLNEAKADSIDAVDNYVLSRKKLTQLMGLENDERSLDGQLPVPAEARVKNLEMNESLKDRSDIQALNLRAQAAEKNQAAAGVWFVPHISIFGDYSYYQQQYIDSQVRNTGVFGSSWDLGLFLKWNLFDGGLAYAQSQEAAARHIQAEKASNAARLQVPYDFVYWKRRYLSNTDHYLSKKFDIQRSEESVRLAKEEERAGARTSTERLDAELDLFRSRAGVVSAQLNAIEAQIHLELSLGREIGL